MEGIKCVGVYKVGWLGWDSRARACILNHVVIRQTDKELLIQSNFLGKTIVTRAKLSRL